MCCTSKRRPVGATFISSAPLTGRAATDDQLQRLRDLVLAAGGDGSAYVLFNNLARVGDARRFVKLLRT